MGALADFWKSERGLLTILIVIGATVLAAIGVMTIQAWQDYTLWIFALYTGSKTVTGAVNLMTAARRNETGAEDVTEPPQPRPEPAPVAEPKLVTADAPSTEPLK